ncbi:hypothetical protein KFK09_019225 [Dendrobium nobile]|uniref:Uncharacterized protein n=1 Tax=Dendrobium nobile TaxID=94219 RepID=A0A8T3AXZ8_DENNO|nr:hypothetical protein KFK09_019225 [Dendrobium nobile]
MDLNAFAAAATEEDDDDPHPTEFPKGATFSLFLSSKCAPCYSLFHIIACRSSHSHAS